MRACRAAATRCPRRVRCRSRRRRGRGWRRRGRSGRSRHRARAGRRRRRPSGHGAAARISSSATQVSARSWARVRSGSGAVLRSSGASGVGGATVRSVAVRLPGRREPRIRRAAHRRGRADAPSAAHEGCPAGHWDPRHHPRARPNVPSPSEQGRSTRASPRRAAPVPRDPRSGRRRHVRRVVGVTPPEPPAHGSSAPSQSVLTAVSCRRGLCGCRTGTSASPEHPRSPAEHRPRRGARTP